MHPGLSILFFALSAAAKNTTIGLETTEEGSKSVTVPMDDCHNLGDYEVLTVSVKTPCRFFTGALTKRERTGYIDAVFCMRKLPSVLPGDKYPGVKDRFDDFVATHINYTSNIHNDGLLLPWHRHFLYLFEKALRDECGYTGHLPYWDWSRYDNVNLTHTALFDNSPTSLSGDGAYNPNEQTICTPEGCMGRGTGGGCVTGGPFADWPTHLGPFQLVSLDQLYRPLSQDAFRYNPRCLQRSFNQVLLRRYTNGSVVQDMLRSRTISELLRVLDPSVAGQVGAHPAGHIALGPTMTDVFSSVQDPVFFLHHGMVDRIWTLWQDQGIERRYALNGTGWIYDPPWAPLLTLDTEVEFGILDRARKIRELMDPRAGDYCYFYV
ncbi:putative polyphenol monooxygenase [Aspergillus clavatus NRRL 1]|uniref:Tyrosinase central domain protein n=1 Tax=Aspergillus clavatus (strain ATCC 1007 / CBS 513.65 / DSM 816 / NCTC 3887 / NRRL 1 / QM 1276 / 107) TaxID=344612 RepID=A1CIU9_ASPCL|nr:tyrosinase central domain protein [Aspergillus clavatus NRRL 1]EAW10804.1 tyrosinase central domain protein [Aspergillus clavatus NRRL 1]